MLFIYFCYQVKSHECIHFCICSQTCIKRSPLEQTKKWSFKTGSIHMKFCTTGVTGQEKCDLLMQATA